MTGEWADVWRTVILFNEIGFLLILAVVTVRYWSRWWDHNREWVRPTKGEESEGEEGES